MRTFLSKHLPPKIKTFLRRIFTEQRILYVKTIPFTNNLTKLGNLYGTDKSLTHHYTQHYQHHFKAFKNKKIKLLEIGVGGYSNPFHGAHSLRMWKRYFGKGKIYSFDIHDKSALQEKRIKIFQGSQVDFSFLDTIMNEIGTPDIIIDDGSHINEHVIQTFTYLFPLLKDGGIYVIEDTQTSYWEAFEGDSDDLQNPTTLMNFFKQLTDCLNYKEFVKPHGYEPSYFDKKIISIHFYHNLIFIYKGDNIEESNILVNNNWKNQ